MMAEITPRWRLSVAAATGYWIVDENNRVISAHIADAETARLFLAARELKAALEAYKRTTANGTQGCFCFSGGNHAPYCRQATAALKKARGES